MEQEPPTTSGPKKGRGRPRKAAKVAPPDNTRVRNDSVVEPIKTMAPNDPVQQSPRPQEVLVNGAESRLADTTSGTRVADTGSKGQAKDLKRDTGSVNKGATHRVGLSRRVRIAPLLKVVRK